MTKLFRAVIDLSHQKSRNGEKKANSSPVTQSLLEDSSEQLNVDCLVTVNEENSPPQQTEEGTMDFHSVDEESIISGNAPSEENSFVSLDPTSPVRCLTYIENDSDSSTGTNLLPDENDKSIDSISEENSSVSSKPISPAIASNYSGNDSDCSTVNPPVSISPHPRNEYPVTQSDEDDSTDKSVGITKEYKLLHGIVQWFRKLKRTLSSEETSDRNASDATKTNNVENKKNQIGCYF